ncbi:MULTISPECIES: GNAT family N-acetyltransferase [unclassified Pusillimonas]|uniref:bifunctional acetate--CoA ligase family protein/GNAT family N-acetyltransferase n=1 Tax=unclassified Pusillimonas TaxID=2640016 RepID=UPI000B9D1789|nr:MULTISPECIES: GNAT family N-acetyltransferase [unclassified Pusillimonas]OXR50739.1 GNAT family N-acetyltransferase [Pusillimonas sp. T2]ROT44797.1 GNAT family N-acetyltransferase [Pusillimonas sp. NJUB218]
MLRHRLAALFDPLSVLVVGPKGLATAQSLPPRLRGQATVVVAQPGQSVKLPATLTGVAKGARLDLAVVSLTGRMLNQALWSLQAHRPRALIVLSPDHPSIDPAHDTQLCRLFAREHDCMVLGPRSLGLQRTHTGLNLSLSSHLALPGKVALVSQSEAIFSAVLDWARDANLGFSTVVSMGDESSVGIAQVLDYLATDSRTDSIAVYLDNVASSRALTSALRAAASVKPVVVLRAGQGARNPNSLSDAVFNALLRRAGAVRVPYFVQLFSAIKVLRSPVRPKGRRIALFSNGSGPPQLALDIMGEAAAVVPAEFSLSTVNALSESLEPRAQVKNPVVTRAALVPETMRLMLAALMDDPNVDGLLMLLAPDSRADMAEVVRQVTAMAPKAPKPIMACLMGEASMRPLRRMLDEVGIPSFRTPEAATNAFGVLAAYHYNQTLSLQTLPPEPLVRLPKVDEARKLVAQVLAEGRQHLTLSECVNLFSYFDIPLELLQPDADFPGLQHVDDVPMAIRVGVDALYGPFINFGSGGRSAISARDRAIELPPLNGFLARQLVERSAIWRRVLKHQMSPAAYERLQEVLERLSDMVCELPELANVLIDPIWAGNMQLFAQGVQVEVKPSELAALPENSGYGHMAIHPYPRQLVKSHEFADGEPWMMRPIRPEDAEPLQLFVRDLSDESRYMRFVSMLRELTPSMLARYTRIDYDRELALVATVQVPNPAHRGHPQEQIVGFAHYLRNADGLGAEYALVISDKWQRHGLGKKLLQGLIEAARAQRLGYIEGFVLANNRAMLGLMTRLGFQNDADAEDPSMRRVWLALDEGLSEH